MTRLIALDVGEVRIGVAVSDSTGFLASPYTTLHVSREEAQTAGVDVYSAASPLGVALTGSREGDTVEYETPTGKTMKVTLVTAKPFSG